MNAVLIQPMKRSAFVVATLLSHLMFTIWASLHGAVLRPPEDVDWADVVGEGALVALALAWTVAMLVQPLRRAVFVPGALGAVLLVGASCEDVLDEFFVSPDGLAPLVENASKLAGALAITLAVGRWSAWKHEERRTLKRDFQRYARISERDGLTGLFNRETLFQRLSAALQGSGPVSVLLLDIDDFKSLNDTYGHLVGDKVLQGLAAELEAHVRGCDVCARYGGEEFVIVVDGAPSAAVNRVAERILVSFRNRAFDVDGVPVHRTVSIGVARGRHGESAEAVLFRADAAMYTAKRSGKNRVHVGE